MKTKLILLSLFWILNSKSFSQDHSLLQGRWKIISVTAGQLYYDLTTDSIFIPKEELTEIYKDGHDSVFAVELFKSKWGDLKNYRFSFDKDSVCLDSGTEISKGIYQFNIRDSIDLFIPLRRGGYPERLRYGYLVSKDVLTLSLPMDVYDLKLVLVKQ
jgi:hypothetical protein